MEHLPNQRCGHERKEGEQEVQPGIALLPPEANKQAEYQEAVKRGECSPGPSGDRSAGVGPEHSHI